MSDLKTWLEQKVIDLCGWDSSHGLPHVRRVYKNAAKLLARWTGNRLDQDALMAAVYFHDLVDLPKNHPDRKNASRLSAEKACTLLEQRGWKQEQLDIVFDAILCHSFSAGIEPKTQEARLLQDADRLEAIGALGIARCFHVAGKMGSEISHPEDPLGDTSRVLDDRAYALDHFPVKLLKLQAMMQTEPGKELAQQRTQVLLDYLQQLREEL